jgi:hypothetical protein
MFSCSKRSLVSGLLLSSSFVAYADEGASTCVTSKLIGNGEKNKTQMTVDFGCQEDIVFKFGEKKTSSSDKLFFDFVAQRSAEKASFVSSVFAQGSKKNNDPWAGRAGLRFTDVFEVGRLSLKPIFELANVFDSGGVDFEASLGGELKYTSDRGSLYTEVARTFFNDDVGSVNTASFGSKFKVSKLSDNLTLYTKSQSTFEKNDDADTIYYSGYSHLGLKLSNVLGGVLSFEGGGGASGDTDSMKYSPSVAVSYTAFIR